MTDTVKMPEPNFSSWHIEDHKSLLNPTGLCNAFVGSPDPDKYDHRGHWKDKGCHREPLFTEAQMKQYGDDRERAGLEKAAELCELFDATHPKYLAIEILKIKDSIK